MTFLFGKETRTPNGGWQPEEARIELTPGVEQPISAAGVLVEIIPEKEADDLLTIFYGGSNLKQIVLPTTGHGSLFAQRETFANQREFASEQHIWASANGKPVLPCFTTRRRSSGAPDDLVCCRSGNLITPSPLSTPASLLLSGKML